jgi:hypothetical protein
VPAAREPRKEMKGINVGKWRNEEEESLEGELELGSVESYREF